MRISSFILDVNECSWLIIRARKNLSLASIRHPFYVSQNCIICIIKTYIYMLHITVASNANFFFYSRRGRVRVANNLCLKKAETGIHEAFYEQILRQSVLQVGRGLIFCKVCQSNQPIFAHRCVFATKFQHLLSERLTSLGIMGEPRVPPLNPPETIVF